MTMPDERTRALRFAGEVLREMLARSDVPEDLKRQARATLRHYPTGLEVRQIAQDVERQSAGVSVCWLAPEPERDGM
jgi:hypothetical protein